MSKYVKYTHPAALGYNADRTYELDEVLKDRDIEMIKVLFTPVDFKWEDLDKKEEVKEQTKRFK